MNKTLLVMLAILPLSGCVAAAVGVGAGAAVATSASQDRGVGGQARDVRIHADVSDRWYREDSNLYDNLSAKVYNRNVLIMGFVENEAAKAKAVELARQVKGVRNVYDEIQIGNARSFSDKARDKWIETQLDTQVTFAENVHNMNYITKVINGTVYIMGNASDDRERQRILYLVRRVSGVKKVISYIDVGPLQ